MERMSDERFAEWMESVIEGTATIDVQAYEVLELVHALKAERAIVKRVEALPNEWTTGTVGSSLGLEGTAGMCEGMKRCAKELKAALKND